MAEQSKKIKLLAWGDYACTTGFATVMSNVMVELHKTGRYDIDVLGINYSGDPYDNERFPGRVFPAMSGINRGGNYDDVYGRQRFLDLLMANQYDVVFMLQDTFIAQELTKGLPDVVGQEIKGSALERILDALPKRPKIVYYFPFDAPPKKDWVTEVIAKMDYPVTYTHWAKQEALKHDQSLDSKLGVIYHGTNLDDFYPIEDKEVLATFRKEWFQGLDKGRFIITNVNRNQSRKDTVRNLMVLKELRRRGHEDVVMYLHMSFNDIGGNILVMMDQLGLEMERDILMPHPGVFNANRGVSVEAMNLIYNTSDCLFTPTLGEGWGLSLTEAFATKLPVVGPRNTSVQEILADNRGFLVDCGETASAWILKEQDLERIRPLTNVDSAADAIERLIAGERPDVEGAYKWARQHSWPAICKQWIALIDKAAAEVKEQKPPAPQFAMSNRAARRAAKKQRS